MPKFCLVGGHSSSYVLSLKRLLHVASLNYVANDFWCLISQDEIDDSRKTLQYAISELQKDVEGELLHLPEAERDAQRTEFAVFVVHNKLKHKLGKLSESLPYVISPSTNSLDVLSQRNCLL